MWFKNLQVYRLPAPFAMTAAALIEALTPQAFTPCTSLELQRQGWVAPRPNGELVHEVNKQLLFRLKTEKKLLPASVIREVAEARAAELEEQQGFKPGRKQMKELKEQVADDLLPRAFSQSSHTNCWIDTVNGWLVIDASSQSKAEDVIRLLLKAIDQFPMDTWRVAVSPIAAMTDWLLADEAPEGFTIDQDTELRATGEGKATVRYVRHTLEADDVRRHIEAGKQSTKLALTWNDKVSFVLTENLTIKRISPLDVLTEQAHTANDDERFDSDMLLMTGELGKLLAELTAALGGLVATPFDPSTQGDLVNEQREQEAPAPLPYASEDELYEQARALVVKEQRGSISLIQRHLRLGYNRAAALLEEMERAGVVSPMGSNGARVVLVAGPALEAGELEGVTA